MRKALLNELCENVLQEPKKLQYLLGETQTATRLANCQWTETDRSHQQLRLTLVAVFAELSKRHAMAKKAAE